MRSNNNHNCCSVNRSSMKPEFVIQTESVQKDRKSAHSLKDMVLIKGTQFLMGTNDREGYVEDKEGPAQATEVTDFYIDRFAVTNRDFAKFIKDTGYITDAEKFGSSFVFHLLLSERLKKPNHGMTRTPWWQDVKGAFWKMPEGPGSTIEDREDHPVVHVSWNDAVAYCSWNGKRLPTEVEWEYAARGGLIQKRYPWGNELTPGDNNFCNIWQGEFPAHNTLEDGYLSTAPVDTFLPNNFGLYQMSGNVWEWCQNNFQDKFATPETIVDKKLFPQTYKTIRGGSYLCHSSYCNRYRVAARTANTIETSSGNIGFRCALSIS